MCLEEPGSYTRNPRPSSCHSGRGYLPPSGQWDFVIAGGRGAGNGAADGLPDTPDQWLAVTGD